MTLAAKIAWSVNATYSGARGLVSGAGALSETGSILLADGTAAGQADGLFSVELPLAAGSTDVYGLSDGLVDFYGATLDFSAIKVILVEADINNTADLVIGGGSWSGPFGPGGTFNLAPGDSFLMASSNANGWPVDDTADEFWVTCAAAANYGMVLIGVSSDISAPAYTVKPSIVGSPAVGVPTVCNEGDVSGSPQFAYRWKRAGVLIPGATAISYIPVGADLGKALSRETYAFNVAGAVTVVTSPAIVLSAPVAGIAADLTAGGTGQTLFT